MSEDGTKDKEKCVVDREEETQEGERSWFC